MSKVLYFSADWCGPCKAMKPIVEKFQEEHSNPEVVRVDADQEFELAQQYKISSVPTFILIDEDGNEINRHRGVLNQSNFEVFALGE